MKKLLLIFLLIQASSCSGPAGIGSGTGTGANSSGSNSSSPGSVFYSSVGTNSFDIYKVINNKPMQINKSINKNTDFDISKDGKKAVYISANNELHISDVDGTNFQAMLKDNRLKMFPKFSPDGSKIVFVGEDENKKTGIYMVNSDGTNNDVPSGKRLTGQTKGDNYPNWSPDGKKISFNSDRDGNTEIYTMNPDGTQQTNITNSPGQDYSPSWSPDSKKIAFTKLQNDQWKIYTVNSDGTNLTNISSGKTDIFPVWSPDNKYIAYVSKLDSTTEAGQNKIQVYEIDNKNNVTVNQGIDSNYPSWSPDGSNLSFKSQDNTFYEILTYNTASKKLTTTVKSDKEIFDTITR